ncbi:MAG TPA: hypothetical protein VGT82_09015 [Ktedonobacteraceae bacterium]|nr:hypothetical protein [Ktedonobacteraceae bacterium]
MNHDFWLFRQGERAYTDYHDLFARRDAPISIDDEVLRYFFDTIAWAPSFNPARNERGNGLNWWGPTIIDQAGGDLFHTIFSSWAEIFTSGPEHLRLRGSFSWQWPYEEPEHLIAENELDTIGSHQYLLVDRDSLIQQLTTLAEFGAQAATGKFFILHLGI